MRASRPRRLSACAAVIDLHSHILPRIDDGPDRDRDSVEMARQAAADGATVIACTPHRTARTPTTPARVAEGIAALQPLIDDAGIPLRLVSGLEITIEQAGRMDDEELRAATLGGGGRWLLIEMPFQGWPLELPDVLTALEVRGFAAVIAHPERAQAVQAQPDRMRDIVGRGAIAQLTADSLTGENGPRPQRTAIHLLRAGFAHVIASDMHSPTWRPPGLTEGLAAAAGALRAEPDDLRWMVDDLPRAIIEGRDARAPRLPGMPALPPVKKRDRSAPGDSAGPARNR
jgi:protein-tyrosine phosphatase